MEITKRELLATARVLGIKSVNSNSTLPELRKAVNEKLGVPDLGTHDDDPTVSQDLKDKRTDSYAALISASKDVEVATDFVASPPETLDIPNLAPTGRWGSRRARLKRTKTGHNDMSGAIFNWNGYICIIPLDVVVDVPWPILNIIRNCMGMNMEIRQEDDPRDKGKVMNIKEIQYYEKYPIQYMGITPGTEVLPASPWEYTLNEYVNGFENFTVRMWRQLCILWEISDSEAKIKPGVGPKDECITRCNAVHYRLNLPLEASADLRERIRGERWVDMGLTEKAA